MNPKGHHNSLVVYTTLLSRLLQDIADCYTNSDSRRDWMKIQSRIDKEGISFLTKSLPLLGKTLDKSLQGRDRFTPIGFQTKPNSTIPKLFGWLFELIFTSQGDLRGDANIEAIKHARQLLYFMYKLALPYEKKTTKKVLDSFVQVEEELKCLQISPADPVIREARTFITRVLSGFCPRDLIPRHGPGAVSTGEKGGEKFSFSRLYESLDSMYPFTEYFRVSCTHTCDTLHEIEKLEVLRAGTAKVVLVPKDSRGPRIISCEPLELQWIQQGIQKKLYPWLESHRLTAGHVNFTDQTVNQRLALSGSMSRDIVTLDMKDASDRVSLRLVQELYSGTSLLESLIATRSTSTKLPNGVVLPLSKFAPMGSALCFPIEALSFYALAVSILRVYKNQSWRSAMKGIFVYGDDIICNRKDYPIILKHFPRFGLMFNASKCCTGGFFRESCGCDAYKGVDITPIRLRTRWNHRLRGSATQLASYVALSNALHEAGYWRSSTYIQQLVEGLYGPLPIVEYNVATSYGSKHTITPPGQVIGWFRPHVNHITENTKRSLPRRFCDKLQRSEVQGYVIRPYTKLYKTDGWKELLRFFTNGRSRLQRGHYAVPHRSRLQRGWGVCVSTPASSNLPSFEGLDWFRIVTYNSNAIVSSSQSIVDRSTPL
jgi:hypothetical protein